MVSAHHHCRHDALPPFSIGNAENDCLFGRGVPDQPIFDLAGIDVRSAADNHVMATVENVQAPLASKRPISPVRSQPPAKEAAFASSSRQYPSITPSLCTAISPVSPRGTRLAAPSRIRTSTPERTKPA